MRIILPSLLALAAIGACKAPTATPRHATPVTVPSVAPPSTGTPSAEPVASASAEPSGVASKPGVIGCGAAACDAKTEVCCFDGNHHSGRCVPAPKEPTQNPCGASESPWRCDENADCGAGQTCCESYACTNGCPLERVCEKGLCSATTTEVCVKGAACRPGRSCKPDSGGGLSCQLDPHSTPCGATSCAPGSACCWNKKTKTESCAKSCPDVADVVTLYCLSPDQCGGYTCADFFMPGRPGGTSLACMAPSLAGDRASTILCRDIADCPRHLGVAPKACRETFPEMPHGVKACVYP